MISLTKVPILLKKGDFDVRIYWKLSKEQADNFINISVRICAYANQYGTIAGNA